MYDTILRYIRTGKLPEDLAKNQKDSKKEEQELLGEEWTSVFS